MTNLRCFRAETLMQQRAAGLLSSEALQLEEHLAGCTACSAQAQMLNELRALVASAGAPLDSVARTRAITSALAATQPAARNKGVHEWLWPATALAMGCTVVVLLALRATSPAHDTTRAAIVSVKQQDHVLAGDLAVNGRISSHGSVIAEAAELRSAQGATVALAHATVELRAQTTLAWNGATRELRLRSGSVVADVDPSAHRSFTVHTERFSVLVLGTQFEVTETAVRVMRGRVRVITPSGAPLALVEAGERFDVKEPAVETPTQVEEKAQPAGSAAQERHPRVDATALLDQARGELADRQVGAARRALDSALQLSLTPTMRAEALSLRADCALVEGDTSAAADAYLLVAERFARLPAGENALFAAARLQSERGDKATAKGTLSLYLARYPQGRFVKEASARLRELGVSVDPAR